MALNNSPGISTFDVVPPYRPTTIDFNGGAKIDDATDPPDAATMPNAAEANTTAGLFASIGRTMCVCTLTVTQVAGSYSISQTAAATAAVVNGTFTVTKNATGDVSITWPANTFPASTGGPEATANNMTMGSNAAAALIANGVRVLLAVGTVATDMNFTVTIN